MLAFIGLPIPKPYSKTLSNIKREHQPKSSKLEPHLTLIPPGELVVDLKKTIAQCKTTEFEPFTIKTVGVGGRRRRSGAVIWLDIAPNEQLVNLQKRLHRKFSEKIISTENHQQDFRPHITILRTKTAAYSNRMFKELEAMNLNFEFQTKEIILYIKEKPEDDWQKAYEKVLDKQTG